VDAVEAVGCEEALDYDYQELLAEAKEATYKSTPEQIASVKGLKRDSYVYSQADIFCKKAFNMVNKHKKKT
jgi:hypothetical protein